MPERKFCPSCGANVYVDADNACPYCGRDVEDATPTPEAAPMPEPTPAEPVAAPAPYQIPVAPPEAGTTPAPTTGPTVGPPASPFGAAAGVGGHAPLGVPSPDEAPKRSGKVTALIVVVILLVLGIAAGGLIVAFGLPVFDATRVESDETTCFSNQRLLEGAVLVYMAAENKDDLGPLLGHGWEQFLLPNYVVDVPTCPTDGGGYSLTEQGIFECEDGTHGYFGDAAPAAAPGDEGASESTESAE